MDTQEANKFEGFKKTVMSQPRMTGTVVVQTRWHSRMLECCIDKRVCMCGAFCPGVLSCQMAEKYGECFCLPILPGAMMMMRTGMRERYNIPGSIVDDWAVHMCCGPCALCQMAKEIKHRMR
ncbi:cornifelin-like isoform X1 [Hypomesus transpacificus]|uniref:cornifelin-like isoform X1 n=1 Tax=Hypomesus transpacificus TaxID=137520 RepID=UPI001F07BDC9|nr:cornifelin-like isoform X1 [Hypomesus transpacificus]